MACEEVTRACREADARKGPAPIIAHGQKMHRGLGQRKLAVKTGY
jgi:hypothetical protein